MRFVYDPLHYALQKDVSWTPPKQFGFAREIEFVPVFPSEIRRLSASLPIVVRRQRGSCKVVALIGTNWVNREVIGDEGQWKLPTIPQVLAVHPFKMVFDDTSQQRILMVARDGDCVSENGRWPFFDNLAQTSAPVRRVMRRLTVLENKLDVLDSCASVLDRLGALRPLEAPASTSMVRRSNADFMALDLELFSKIDPSELDAVKDDLPILMRLAGAMAISQRRLSTPVLQRFRPLVDAEQLDKSVLSLLTRFEASKVHEAFGSGKSTTSDELEFLVDDESVLKFDFTASGSVFRSG